jgi:hypothetical protein
VAARKKSKTTGRFEVTFDGENLRVTPRWPAEIYARGLRFRIISEARSPWLIQKAGKKRKK